MSIPFVLESLFVGSSILAAATSFMLGQIEVTSTPEVIESAMEMRLIMVPLLGGVFTMLGAVFLNPSIETNHVKIGRACFGVFAAVVTPQVIGWVHPNLKDVGTKPFMLFLIGGVFAFLGFVFSRSVVQGIYNRSGRLAEKALDNAESKYFPPKPPPS